MSPLVTETATIPVNPTIISAQMHYISGFSDLQDAVAANDTEPTGKRSILECRRKRRARRTAH